MNKVYRLVWNHAQQAWVVASELARGATKGASTKRARASLAAPVAMAALAGLPLQSWAANYVVSNEAELRQAIVDANAHSDASSTITLTADITVTDPSAFAQVAKSLTIDTSTFSLSGATAVANVAGTSLSFLGGPIVVTGAFTGGAAQASSSNATGGRGLALANGALDNSATITGGAGGFSQRTVSTSAGAGGSGAALTNSSLVNRGTLIGGLGGQMDNQGYGSSSSRYSGSGGAGLTMTGGSLDNQSVIRGGVGGAIINAPSSADNSWGGVGGIGASLSGGTHVNSGTIVGGEGGPGANKGGSAGAGAGGAGLVLSGGAVLVNQVGASVTGGQGVSSLFNGGPASTGGVGAKVAGATLQNYGTITGGSSGNAAVSGQVGITGTGSAVIVNDGRIVGGTPLGGATNNTAVAFSGGNNLLELRSNSSISGNVLGGATDTLALGGAVDASFDVSRIGPAAQYRNFGAYHKLGASTWTLTGATAAVTPWTLREGVLSVSAENSLGAATGALTFDGGTLEVTGTTYSGTSRAITSAAGGGSIDIDAAANVFTISSAINGAGGLTKLGDGTLVFTADNTYAGATTLSAGTLQLGAGGTTGGVASGTLLNNGALVINRSNDMTIAGAISGSGSLSQVGAGITTLGGINTYSGGTTISGGTLLGSATSFGSGAILDNGALVLDQVSHATLGNLVSGSGTLTKQGSGTLSLTAANSYTGATSVNAGSLFINGNQSAANGLTTVQTGGTLGGTGTIGGSVVVNDATLAPGANGVGTLTILGDLTLGANSVLGFELGAAGVVGGAFNDLLEVQGNLTLDGTLDVAVSAGGNYGPGFYRLINYSGTLVDNTLNLGTMPAGAVQTLQTSVAGEVNLINTQGLVLRWWDGDAGVRHDGVIAGGAGAWLADAVGTNINWTDETGTPNGAFLDSSFAMFTNAPGTVTVDDSLGAVRVAGMQFTVDGYRVEGDALTLSSGANTIRVGDGTAASANMSATIAADLTGAGRLDKGDGGTLILTADNSYTGGTAISGGTLQLGNGGTTGGIVGDVVNNATLSFNRSDAMAFGGAISGAGSVNQLGSGNTTLSGANTYSGGTTISAGTLTGSATSFGSGGIDNQAALVINQPVNALFSNVISGAGSFTKQGAGVLTLTGNNTLTGLTTIAAGTLQLGNGGTSGSLSGDVVNNGLLSFNRSDAVTYAGNVFAFGNVTHAGTGTTTLTGAGEVKILAVTAGELRLADGARMQIQGGANDNLLVGGTATPVLTLTGSGTSLTMSNAALRIVDTTAGNGIANIENGAEVKVAAMQVGNGVKTGKQAVLNISGEAARLEVAGLLSTAANAQSGGRAEVNVSDGASVSVSSHTSGGIAPVGVIAAATLSGAGTSWTNVGTAGLHLYAGSLDILDRAAYRTTVARIGSYNGISRANTGSVRVDGSGSGFTSNGDVTLGMYGTTTGIATLSNGGSMTVGGNLNVAAAANSTGRLNIGAASGQAAVAAGILNASTLSFGAGTGSLTFNHTDTDYVFSTAVSGNGTIGHEAGTTILTGNGSAFAGTTTVNGGTLYVGDGGLGSLGNAASTLTVASDAALGGSGTIGGAVTVADGGTLAPGNSPGTLTMGTLTLSNGSLLDYELGARSVVGGALNDLINVNGDLTLDGTLNITQAAGGSFDVGIYRLINYTGALTDNTLDLGTLPAGSNVADFIVQTAVASQVNLINTGGLQFRFWDGPVGHANGAFDGNDGVWLATSDSNWTVFDPFANGAWTDAAFAVFQGTPGTVTVDASAGAVQFSGAQFLVDGYVIDGADALNTTAANTVVRVGDGTAAGGAMTAMINAQIAGSGGLVKSDAGTLVLGGDNTYTGGTTISGGTLQLGNGGTTGSVVASNIANEGTLAFNRADDVSFVGAISGNGAVTQFGGGTTTLGDANTYSGGTTIAAGTLAGTASSFGDGAIVNNGALRVEQVTTATMANAISGTGNVIKQGSGTLNLTGDSSSFAGTTNVTGGTLHVNGTLGNAASALSVSNGATLGGAGNIGGSVTVTDGHLAAGNSPGTLTIAGDLALDAASILDFELGEAGVVGGALNDLIVVGGDLTLDGTLNVNASVGGAYGAGIYRLIDYSGTLTDNGLQLGLMPAGSTNYVQTSIAQQVNLVNTQGLLLRYWDGPTLPRNNDRIDGGNGVWLAAGDENWTLPDGSINGAYQDAAYAIFAGAPGTVTVDDSAGAINVSGMQFAVDGYRIEGAAVALVAGSNEIRVGDSSAASAGYRATIASELTGAGALNKRDLGTLVLTSANSYTGGTTISEGTLQLGEGGTSGSVIGDIANNGALAFDRSNALTFGGVISGTGAVHQIGAGATTLTGVNTYTGMTRIDSGTLALSGAGSIASSSNVVADGVFDISATNGGASITTLSGSGSAVLGAKALTLTAATGAFDGVVTGAGTLNKAGADTWTLTGAGSAVGALNVQSGSLAIASGASAAAQTTHVTAGTALLNAGSLSGTTGADLFVLDGRLTGNASMLDGDDLVQIASGADFAQAAFDGGAGVDTLKLTHGSALTYRDTLATNFEHLVKRGGGVLTFEGAVTGFSDSIAVAQGAAHLSNAVLDTSRIHVQAGATLTGSGSMNGDLANDGLLSPGASPGTLTVGGDFVQSASGALRSEIQRGGNDLLNITGSARLAGTHQVQIDYGLYLDGTTQTLLRSTGGVSGTFGTVTINPSALMSADHRVGGNDVTVSFARQATTTVTQPGTGRGNFAEWVDEQIAGGGLTPGMIEYIDTLLQQPTAEQASNLLGEMAEPITSTSQESASILGAGFAGAVFDRFVVNDRAQCASTDNLDAARSCAWIHGSRQWGDASGDRFGPRYDWTTDGVQIGIDHTTAASWTLGVSAGYADTDTRDVRGGRNNLRSTLGGLYANYAGDRLGASAVLLYADHESRTTRNATLGATTHQARSQFDYNSYGAGLRLDYRLTDAQHPLVRPFAEVFYDRIEGSSFAEHDAGAGNLTGRIHAREGLRGTLGVRFADDYEGYGLVFRPSLELGVVHQFLDTQSTLDLLPFGSAAGFRAHGVQLDRTAVKANAALDISVGRNATLGLGYGGELAGDRSQHEVSLGFRVMW